MTNRVDAMNRCMDPAKTYTAESTRGDVLALIGCAYGIRALLTAGHCLEFFRKRIKNVMDPSLIGLLLNDVPRALCNVQESKATVSFFALPSGEVRMTVTNTIADDHTRRSQTLHDALPEESIRYMIQQCLQKQPGKKWQAISVEMIVGKETLRDVILIHHYYGLDKKKRALELNTETLRLNMLPPPSSQSLKMQDVLHIVDMTFKRIFSALNYPYMVHNMTRVTTKDVKRYQKYLSSPESKLRPAGQATMRELAADVFATAPLTPMSLSAALLFALLSTVLMNVVDAYETLDGVEKRLLNTLQSEPGIFILMLSDMKGQLRPVGSSQPLTSDGGVKVISTSLTTLTATPPGVVETFSSSSGTSSTSTSMPPSPTPEAEATPISPPPMSDQALADAYERFIANSPSEQAAAYDSIRADVASMMEPDVPSSPDKTIDEDDYIDAVSEPIPAADEPLRPSTVTHIRLRHPLSRRCFHVGGKTFNDAVQTYGLDEVLKWSPC